MECDGGKVGGKQVGGKWVACVAAQPETDRPGRHTDSHRPLTRQTTTLLNLSRTVSLGHRTTTATEHTQLSLPIPDSTLTRLYTPAAAVVTAMLSLYVLLSLAILLLLVLHLVTRTKNPSVPGPTPLPIIGNLLTMLPFAKINRPGLCFEAVAKQYGPVARLTLPGKDIVIVTSHALAKRVLRGDGGKFSKGTELQQALEGIAPHGLFALPDGPDWTRHRKKLQPAFGPLQLRGALEIASKLGKETYDFFDAELGAGRREQDFYKTFTCLTADTLWVHLDRGSCLPIAFRST